MNARKLSPGEIHARRPSPPGYSWFNKQASGKPSRSQRSQVRWPRLPLDGRRFPVSTPATPTPNL